MSSRRAAATQEALFRVTLGEFQRRIDALCEQVKSGEMKPEACDSEIRRLTEILMATHRALGLDRVERRRV